MHWEWLCIVLLLMACHLHSNRVCTSPINCGIRRYVHSACCLIHRKDAIIFITVMHLETSEMNNEGHQLGDVICWCRLPKRYLFYAKVKALSLRKTIKPTPTSCKFSIFYCDYQYLCRFLYHPAGHTKLTTTQIRNPASSLSSSALIASA